MHWTVQSLLVTSPASVVEPATEQIIHVDFIVKLDNDNAPQKLCVVCANCNRQLPLVFELVCCPHCETVYCNKMCQKKWFWIPPFCLFRCWPLSQEEELFIYSWLSLSRPRLSQITAYLEVKIWSLPKHENLITDGKYCRKEEKLLLRSNFSSFQQYFQYISNFKSPITYQFVKCG